jgi:cytochrome c biogenesis factor
MFIFLIKLFCIFFLFFFFNKFIYLEKFSLQKINLFSISFLIKTLFILVFFLLFQLIKELIFYQLNFELISFLTSNSIKIWYKIFNIFSDFNTTLIIWILLSFSFFEVINKYKINIKLMYMEKYKYFSFFINIYILLIYLFITSIIFHYNKQIFIQFKINMLLYNLILLIHPILIYLSYTYIIYILGKILFCFRQNFLIQDVILFKHIENIKKFKVLSFSIILGGIWAYTQLGWGGFWFWDPIENISLILWLVLVIFFHVKEYNFLKLSKKLFFIFFSFFLIIYLFLITRSGLVTSVHSFVINKNFFLLCITFYIFFFCYYIFTLYNLNKIYIIKKTKLNIDLISKLIYIFLIFNLLFISNINKYNILFFFFVNIIIIYYIYILYKKENFSKIYKELSEFHFKIFFFGILLYFIFLKKKTIFLTFFTDTHYILAKNIILFLNFKFLQKSDIYIQEIKNYSFFFNDIFYNFEFKKTINFTSTENIKLNIEIIFNFISNIYINFVEFLNLNILKFEIKEFICFLIYFSFFFLLNKKKKKYGIIE